MRLQRESFWIRGDTIVSFRVIRAVSMAAGWLWLGMAAQITLNIAAGLFNFLGNTSDFPRIE